MSRLEAALLDAGERMRAGVDTGEERLSRVHSAVLARVRIQVLRGRLEPMCGTGSAERVIRLAARRSDAQDPRDLTGERWPAFVTHLGSIMAALCGASPARNIVSVARRLAMEEAA